MSGNGYICGWYDVGTNGSDGRSVLHDMAGCFQVNSRDKLLNSDRLNMATSGDVCNLAGEIDVAITGTPYWKSKDLSQYAEVHGDAATCAKLYRDRGMGFLELLGGRFVFVLHDKQDEKLVLGLDRMGQQHCFYAQAGNGVVFSTRANAVVAHPAAPANISSQGIYNYLYFHAIPSPSSIYEGIHKLTNGEYLTFKKGSVTRHTYWKPLFHETTEKSLGDLSEEMLGIIEKSVARVASAPSVGAFLSGGLDSSTVSGMLSKVTGGKARTFSIGFDAKGYDEIAYARIASKHFGTDQNEYYVTPEDVVAQVQAIAGYFDEPFGNSSALPAFFCAKMAKERGVDRLLAGDGGDEIFAGNERYAKQGIFELYGNIPSVFRRFLIEPLFLHNPVAKDFSLFRKANSYIAQANVPLPDRLEAYNFLHRHLASEIFVPDFLCDVDPGMPLEILRGSYQSIGDTTSLNKMLWLDWKKTLHDNDLVKVNRMCEMAGVEVVYPLLDDDLVDFSCRIPTRIKMKNGKLRWFYKEAVKTFLPAEIITKSKHGFGLPFGMWTSQHKGLQELSYSALDALKRRDIFREEFIDKTIRMHKEVHAGFYGELVWVLMMLELWLAKQ